MCLCCGCCCQVLKNIKYKQNSSELVHTNWYAKINNKKCIKCKNCLNKCQTNAIEQNKSFIKINKKKCIGCGNCVLFCHSNSIKLCKKSKIYNPPNNMIDTYKKIYEEKK